MITTDLKFPYFRSKLCQFNLVLYFINGSKMPTKQKSTDDNENVREKILDAALEILYEEGFAGLSMRKIALRAKMTAANLYNYYSNKDEICLNIKTRGYSILLKDFKQIEAQIEDPFTRMQQLIRSYIAFGLNSVNQYDIIFSQNTPKYSDYVGTPNEAAAMKERDAAISVLDIAGRTIVEMRKASGQEDLDDASYQALRIWTGLHGIVSLMNNRFLVEVDPEFDYTIEKLVNDLVDPFNPKSLS